LRAPSSPIASPEIGSDGPGRAATKPVPLPASFQPAEVLRVTDGDTIQVSINGESVVVRYLLIDTPETVDPRTGVQCMGREASARNKELVEGEKVFLEPDVTDRIMAPRLHSPRGFGLAQRQKACFASRNPVLGTCHSGQELTLSPDRGVRARTRCFRRTQKIGPKHRKFWVLHFVYWGVRSRNSQPRTGEVVGIQCRTFTKVFAKTTCRHLRCGIATGRSNKTLSLYKPNAYVVDTHLFRWQQS
jgi:hypothetical protein